MAPTTYRSQMVRLRPESESPANDIHSATADQVTGAEETVGSIPKPSSAWPVSLGIAATAIVCLVILFRETAWSMVKQWESDAYGHGFLIVPVSAFLIWRRRAVLAQIRPKTQYCGLLLMACSAFGWLIGSISNVYVVEQFAFVAMIPSLLVTIFGWEVVRNLIFPLFFLFFAVPFGDFLIPTLQDVTARFAASLLRATGIPIFMDGVMLHIPSGSFVVAKQCAGVRFLLSSVVLGSLGAHLMYKSWRRRLAFMILALVVPIIANGLRVYGIVMIGHFGGYEYAVGVDHIVYGWVFFSIVTLCLLGIGMTFREQSAESLAARSASVSDNGPGASASPFSVVVATSAALVVAGVGPVYSHVTEYRAAQAAQPKFSTLEVRSPWSLLDVKSVAWRPRFANVDGEIRQAYGAGDARVNLYVAYYGYQVQGAEVISQVNRLHGGLRDGWVQLGRGEQTAMLDGIPQKVRYINLRHGDERVLVWYWYWVDDKFTASRILAKLLEVKAELFGRNTAAAAFALATEYEDRPEEAATVLQDFLNHASSMAAIVDGASRSQTLR